MSHKKALLVDDEVIAAMRISKRIRRNLGIYSDTATDVKGALEKALNNKYDLCICDGLDGGWIELHNYFASESPETRFILYSSNREHLDEAESLGTERYNKPHEFERMMRALDPDL